MKKKNIAAAMIAASMPLLSISAAHATPDTTSAKPSETKQSVSPAAPTAKQDANGAAAETKVEVTQELIDKYSEYVTQEGDQFRLNAPENLKSENAQEVSKVQQIIDTTNEEIVTGKAEVTDNEGGDETVETAAGKHKASGTHGGYVYQWWGVQFWLDEWATQEYTKLLSQNVSADKIAAEFCAWTGIKNTTVVKISHTLRIDAEIVRTSNWHKRGIIINAPIGHKNLAWCLPRPSDDDNKVHRPNRPA